MADEEEYVQTSLPEVFVYKIPPKSSAAGHKASDWKDQVWTGKLQVVSKSGSVAVKLVGEDGKIFAVAPIRKDGPPAVEKVADSSRYFVLRIENDKGQYAFIGIGFNNRSDAFDFNVAIQDAQKEEDASKVHLDLGPTEDLSFKQGEKITIKVNIGGKTAGGSSKPAATTAAPGGLSKLAPPGALRPPTTAAPAAGGDDILGLGGSFGGMSVSSKPSAPAPAPAASSWETF